MIAGQLKHIEGWIWLAALH